MSHDGSVINELWSLDTKNANWASKTIEVPGIVWEKISINDSL